MKTHITLLNPAFPSWAPEVTLIPLGISYLAAVLENDGYEVDVIDCQVLNRAKRKIEDELTRLQPDVVGVTSTTLTYAPAVELVRVAKETCPNCLTIMGGPHVTVMDEQTLKDQTGVDIVVRGEGEDTIIELADLVSESSLNKLGDVTGITFRKNGQIVRTPNRPFIENLDKLPHPAFNRLPLTEYQIRGKCYLPIITSRGCPFNCTFCLISEMCGKRFRARSPKNVVDELEWLRDVHGADAFAFYDAVFTLDRKRAIDICEEKKKRKIDLPWDCTTRADQVSKEVLVKLKEANCKVVYFGVESGSQKILDSVNKGITVEQNEKAIKWTKEAGMSAFISVVVGYPGETEEMLKQTFDFIDRTKPDHVCFCLATPYPGTRFFNLVEDFGWELSKDWSHYDEHVQVFKNPLLPPEKIEEAKRAFYDKFFSPSYIIRKSLKRDFHNQALARTALNHYLWRTTQAVSRTIKKIKPQKKQENTEKIKQ